MPELTAHKFLTRTFPRSAAGCSMAGSSPRLGTPSSQGSRTRNKFSLDQADIITPIFPGPIPLQKSSFNFLAVRWGSTPNHESRHSLVPFGNDALTTLCSSPNPGCHFLQKYKRFRSITRHEPWSAVRGLETFGQSYSCIHYTPSHSWMSEGSETRASFRVKDFKERHSAQCQP